MGKYLGQHFLINRDKLREIVEVLELKNGDTIIEIGPGHGELTDGIMNYVFAKSESPKGLLGIRVIAIEKDKKLADDLQKKFSKDKNVEIIHGDALKILPELTKSYKLKAKSYKIVGNIPYYITGYLLRILGELKNKPFLIVLTIQKEVAERICGKPKKGMNLLAASVQFWAEPKIIGYISKKDFQPAPEVDSAIIRLAIRVQPLATRENTEKYYQFIKILFKQPRKTISNNLRQTTNDIRLLTEKLKALDIDPQARPQDLSIEQIKGLSTLF